LIDLAAGETAKLNIAPAGWRQLRQVMDLEQACFQQDAWPWLDLLAALTFPETVRLLAIWDGQPAGFVVGDRRSREGLGWIASIGVHPDFRRRGIGGRLLQECERALKVRRVRLTLRVSNQAARRLYQVNGYYEVEVWKAYYRDGEDALLMEKVMPPV
jgi:ribosomal protein S18 acetylase RimI-like enzyme